MTLVTNPRLHQNRWWKDQSNKENSLTWTYYNIKIITTFTNAININSIEKKEGKSNYDHSQAVNKIKSGLDGSKRNIIQVGIRRIHAE